MRRAARGIGIVTLFILGCQSPPIDWARWDIPEVPNDGAAQLAQRMERLESEIFARHVSAEGLLQYRIPVPPDEATGTYLELADQACWTGYLLAALCFRAELESREAGAPRLLPTDCVDRIERVLDGMLLLESVTGVEGLIARCVVPTEVARQIHNRPEDWRMAQCDRRFAYRADVSKDQYSGYIFGIASAAKFAPRADQRDRARRLLARVARHLDRHELRLIDHTGSVTRFGDVRGRIAGMPIGVNAAIALSIFESARAVNPESVSLSTLARAWGPGLADSLSPLHVEFFGVRNYSNALMASVGVATVALVSEEGYVRERARDSYRSFLRAFVGEGNAFFYSVGVLLGLEDSEEAAHCYRNLFFAPEETTLFPLDPARFEEVDRRLLPSRKGRPRGERPLPLAVRPPTSFRWRSDPFLIDLKPDAKGETKLSGVDLLAAYWFGRFTRWIPAPAPAHSSLPASPGSSEPVPPTRRLTPPARGR